MTLRNAQDVINVMRTTVDQGTKTGAKVEYRFGEVGDIDGLIAAVYLDGNTTASEGFRIPVDLEVDEGDHVRVAISYGSNLGKWVEEVMQCPDRETDSSCSKVVTLLEDGIDSDLSVGYGPLKRIYVSNGDDLLRYRPALNLIWHRNTTDGIDKIARAPSMNPILKGTAGYDVYTGAEKWDISGSVTGLDFAFMEPGAATFWLTTNDSKLQRRATNTGSLSSSISLSENGSEIRRTPTGQYVAVRQGTGTIKIYNQKLVLQQTISITSFFSNDDWNVDEAFNLYRLSSGVLKKYNKSGTELWSVDIGSSKNYHFPSRQSFGTGQQLYIDDFVRVCGYTGGADWTSGGSEAIVITLARSNGDIKLTQTWGGDSSDGAQAMAMLFIDSCMYVFGACTGDTFEDVTIGAGIRGFGMRVGDVSASTAGDGGGEGGADTSHTHTLDALSTVLAASPYAPIDGQVLTYSSAYQQWYPKDAATSVGLAGGVDVGIFGPTANQKIRIRMKYNGVFTGWTVMNDAGGSIQFDLWKDTIGNYPPVVGDSITASDKPKTTSASSATGSCTGWVSGTKAFSTGDVIVINVDSTSGVTETTLALAWTRT